MQGSLKMARKDVPSGLERNSWDGLGLRVEASDLGWCGYKHGKSRWAQCEASELNLFLSRRDSTRQACVDPLGLALKRWSSEKRFSEWI